MVNILGLLTKIAFTFHSLLRTNYGADFKKFGLLTINNELTF